MEFDSAPIPLWLASFSAVLLLQAGEPPAVGAPQGGGTKLKRLATQDSRNFGNEVSAVGDVDGDGTPDLLIAEPPWEGGTKTVGAVWILSGRDGHTIHRVVEGEDQTAFARVVSAAGDLDADGHADWMVASNDHQPDGNGIVEAFSGRTGARLYRWRGRPGSSKDFGLYLGKVGDVDGDGHADVLISGTAESPGTPTLATVFSGHDGKPLLRIPPLHPGDYTAASACAAGDLDRDGTGDIAFGIYSGQDRRFEVQVRSGRTGVVLRANAPSIDLGGPLVRIAPAPDCDGDGLPEICASGSTAAAVILGSRTGRVLLEVGRSSSINSGGAVAPAGDLDGDGRPDVWRGEDATGIAEGRVTALSGSTGAALWTWRDGARDEAWHVGHSLADVGDVDGDGWHDVLVGTDHSISRFPGLAYLLSGKTGMTLLTLEREPLR